MNNYIYLILAPILLRIAYSIWKRNRNIKISFQDKLIWITGASSGIGEELAYQLSRLGASLIISSRRESELNRVRQACQNPEKVHVLPLDLEKPQEVLEKASKFIYDRELKVDILINNGGISMRAGFLENAFENEITMINVNYLSQVALTKAVISGMLERKSGQIVFMNSLQGKLGVAFRTSYSASKHALTGFADSLRAEVEEHGVSITSLHPGYVNTNLSKNALSAQAGRLHGKTDATTSKGLSTSVFVNKALRAIYLKERETIIADTFKNGAAVPLRNIVPDLIFKLVEMKKKKELREAKQKTE